MVGYRQDPILAQLSGLLQFLESFWDEAFGAEIFPKGPLD